MDEETVHVLVRFFGYAAELAGRREIEIALRDATVAGVASAVRRECPAMGPLIDGSLRYAVGTDYADRSSPVRNGDVVSFLPPVAGG